MKLTTKISLVITFLFIFGEAYSQSCEAFYPMKKGSVIETQNFNAKNKLTGSNRQTILDVATGVNSASIKVKSETFDAKGKDLASQELVMRCENGVFMMDMKNFLDPKAMGGGEMEVKIDAKDMEYPQTLSPGLALKDASIRMTLLSNGMTIMSMETRIFNRKVEGIENVTTPAGTFECYKISYESEMKAVVKVRVKGVQYIAKGVGVVRSESYDKNGKLTDYNVISKLSGL
jgi:hypothetical protein